MKRQKLIIRLNRQADGFQNGVTNQMNNAERERRFARDYLAKGSRFAAQVRAKSSAQEAGLATFLAEIIGPVRGLACDLALEQVYTSTLEELEQVMNEMDRYMTCELNLVKIAAMAVKYDQLRGNSQQLKEILLPDEASIQMNADALLCELEKEIEKEVLAGGARDIPKSEALEATPT
jgi:hypothetical protein